MIYYTIVIPIHNEFKFIPNLIKSLEIYGKKKNEILIIDDGSTDGSTDLLINNDLINLIKLEKNQGKGFAIRQGLKKAKYNKIVIFDGDMELNVLDISRLMILDKKKDINIISSKGCDITSSDDNYCLAVVKKNILAVNLDSKIKVERLKLFL